jgi:hypothetical protein
MNYRDPRITGEVKYIWEINRHQHLLPLALAFFVSHKPHYAEEVLFQITDWIEQNPYRVGINWTSALEAALRLLSWTWVFFLLGRTGQRLTQAFFRAIGEHCRFIHGNFSLYSSRGNHLVGEASGLFLASLVFAREPHRSLWLGDAYRILTREILEQVHPDGSHAELSTGYHQFVTELFLLPALLGKINGIDFPQHYWDRLAGLFRYLAHVQNRPGCRPDLGDNDAAHCLPFDGTQADNTASLLTTGAILFNQPQYLGRMDSPDTKTLLLLGPKAQETFRALKQEAGNAPWASKGFSEAGYYVLRAQDEAGGSVFLLFDGGLMGLEPMAGHGHADALSVYLAVDGKPFFVDPGTYTYLRGDPWREYFRGTSAHNTLRVDREEQAVSGGSFFWLRKARCNLEKWEPEATPPRVRASHDGYLRLKDPVLHTREIRLDMQKRQILIVDQIRAKERHLIEVFFHTDPRCRIRSEEDTHWIVQGERRIGLVPDPHLDIRIVKGREDPPLGWYSPRYGRKEPSNTLVGSHTLHGTATYQTQILL